MSEPMPSAPPAAPVAAPVNQPEVEAVPSSWPGGFGVYKHAKEAAMFNLNSYLLTLVAIVAGTVLVAILASVLSLPEAISQFLQTVVQVVLGLTMVIVLFSSLDRVKIEFGDALNKTWPLLVQYVILSLLTFVIAFASIIALIVPFFFIVPRIVLAPYLLVRDNLSAVDALQASWNMTKGHVGKVYGIFGVNLVFVLLMVTIVGIPFAIYFLVMYGAAFNILADYVRKNASAA